MLLTFYRTLIRKALQGDLRAREGVTGKQGVFIKPSTLKDQERRD